MAVVDLLPSTRVWDTAAAPLVSGQPNDPFSQSLMHRQMCATSATVNALVGGTRNLYSLPNRSLKLRRSSACCHSILADHIH
jgi:hypothetical protein